VSARRLLPWRAARRIREQDEQIRVLVLTVDYLVGRLAGRLPGPPLAG
jgi:hypothetical protein